MVNAFHFLETKVFFLVEQAIKRAKNPKMIVYFWRFFFNLKRFILKLKKEDFSIITCKNTFLFDIPKGSALFFENVGLIATRFAWGMAAKIPRDGLAGSRLVDCSEQPDPKFLRWVTPKCLFKRQKTPLILLTFRPMFECPWQFRLCLRRQFGCKPQRCEANRGWKPIP